MKKKMYESPVLWEPEYTGPGNVIGEGSNQGSFAPDGMSYEDWWEEIAWGGENPDADYNGDGKVDIEDWNVYSNPIYWDGDTFIYEP